MAYDLSRAQYRAAIYGYTVVQRTSFESDEIPGNPIGWTDHRTKRCYVFVDRLLVFTTTVRAKVARKVAMHEVGHARWKARLRNKPDMLNFWRYVRGMEPTTDQKVEEDYCETYSKIKDPQTGVSYTFRSPVPTSAQLTALKPLL